MVEGFCNCFSADFCFFSDFFAFLRSLRQLRAAAKRFLRGRTAVFSTACSGASRQAAAAAAQRCTAGCTVQCQHTAPSSSAAMEMLGEVYLSNGQNDEAKALFSSYLSTDGFAAAANNGLALCALAENDTDSALSYIEEGLKTAEDSDRENLLFNQIVSYEKRADFDTAKSLMADFLAAYPENTAAQRENTFLQNR